MGLFTHAFQDYKRNDVPLVTPVRLTSLEQYFGQQDIVIHSKLPGRAIEFDRQVFEFTVENPLRYLYRYDGPRNLREEMNTLMTGRDDRYNGQCE